MHQGAWLVWASAAGLVAALTTNPFYLLPLTAAAIAVYTSRGEPSRGISFRAFVVFAIVALGARTSLVFVAFLVGQIPGVTAASIVAAALEGLRLAVLLVIFGAFNSVSDPFRLLRLAPRRFHELALAAALALSIAPRTIAAASRVREAQRLRGIAVDRWRGLPALAVPVLELGMEQAVLLAESMDARGHGRGRRTRYRPERWNASSGATVVVSVLAAGVVLGAARSGTGDLSVDAWPLQWPQVSAWVVAAVLALSLPAFIGRSRP